MTILVTIVIRRNDGIENEAMIVQEIVMRGNTSPHVEREVPQWTAAGEARMTIVRTSAGSERGRTKNAGIVIEARLPKAGIDPNTTINLGEMQNHAMSHAPITKRGPTETAGDKIGGS